MKVPFNKNNIEYLNQIHSENAHRGFDFMRNFFISKNIYYKGIIKDIKLIIRKCSICKLKKNELITIKKEKFNLIIFQRPKERYIGDLSVIPYEFLKNKENKYFDINSKYKYIFTIIDHFSKFSDSFLLIDKTQKTILEKLKFFFEFYGEPESFGCDNGKEFVNPSVNNYLNNKNIKIINGLPYNPRSQGAVERIHITVRNQLLALYLENIVEFNLETAIVKVMNIYNKAIHKVTKYSPNEIFYSHDENLFKKVHENILDFFNKNQKKESIFKSNEKCLLLNNFIISKNKAHGYPMLIFNKVKKKQFFFKIMCRNFRLY